MWLVYSSERRYIVDGAREAERVRRERARWHGCVFRKRPATSQEVAEVRR